MLRAVQTWWTSSSAQPILIGRRDVIAAKVAGAGPAAGSRRATCGCSTRSRTRTCSRRCWRATSSWSSGAACRPMRAARWLPAAPPSPPRMLLACGRGRCGDLRRRRRLVAPARIRPADHSAPAGRDAGLCAVRPDPAAGVLFFCDTHVKVDPTAEQIAEMTLLAAEAVRRLRHRAEGGAAVAFQFRRLATRRPRARCARRWR